MKDYYTIHEGYTFTDKKDYQIKKRNCVLETIKPICDVFEIKEYDYILDDEHERLVVERQSIGCCCNSIGAIVMELIAYIFLNTYCENRYVEDKLIKELKRYYIKEET
jgi:hypothetical protein